MRAKFTSRTAWKYFEDRNDWTTGAPHDGNEWKKYRVVARAHPSRTLLYAYFTRSENKGAFSFPGATWDRFRCTVEPSDGHMRCRILDEFTVRTTKITDLTFIFFQQLISQEPRKGGFSEGGFCRIRCHPKKPKFCQGIGTSSTFGTQSATVKRGVSVCKNPLLETPFSWLLNQVINYRHRASLNLF